MPCFTFIDVETPNRHNDRICSIGLVTTDERGNVLESRSQLVNPESSFDEINMRITGIAPIDVKSAPSFPDVWETTVAPMLNPDALVAHNATFDLNVLAKTMLAYEMDLPHIEYACTMKMAQAVMPDKRPKLPELCEALGIRMGRHHCAIDDAEACANLFWSIQDRFMFEPSFSTFQYEPRESHCGDGRRMIFSDKTIALREIIKTMEGFASAGQITFEEASTLLSLMLSDDELANDQALSSVFSTLQESVMDGFIEAIESKRIVGDISRIIDPAASSNCRTVAFHGKKFVLTGSFEHGTKDAIKDFIESKGGEVIKSVTKQCDYVVVGGCGSEAYSLGRYGSKVKKAMEWQAKGVPIEIITESQLYDA